MKVKQPVFVFSFFCLYVFLLTCPRAGLSQPDYNHFEDAETSFRPIFLSLPHNIDLKEGTSFAYIFPAFFTTWGQATFYYRNSNEDGFYAGLGTFYLIAGINKKIRSFEKAKIYVNFSYGGFWFAPDNYDNYSLGSFGFSCVQALNKSTHLEISLDAFYHRGYTGDYFLREVPYLQGLAGMGHFNYKMTRKIYLTFSAGLSFIKYRYMKNGDYGRYFRYVTFNRADHPGEFYSDPNWDSHFQFPIGLSFSYRF